MSEPGYKLMRLYLRNLSVESPGTGRMPRLISQPNINVDIDPAIVRVTDAIYEVSARFTVSARANNTPLYLVELTQAGLFEMQTQDERQADILLHRVFPQFLFPAARSSLASFVVAAGYQPLVLDHIRLEALFINTPVADRRQKPEPIPRSAPPVAPAPAPASVAEPALFPVPEPVQKRGAGIIVAAAFVAVLVWLGWYLAKPGENAGVSPAAIKPAPVAAEITSAVAVNVAPPPASGPAAASQVAQAEVAGEPLAALLKTGHDWLMAQQKNDYTVEVLRTSDLKAIENVAPNESGQPLFLVKAAGQYAVLSGAYANEEAAKRAARSAGRAAHLSEFQ